MAERRTFTKTIDGSTVTTYAYTPADAVQLEFNGWRELRQTKPAPQAAPEKAPASKARAAAADKTDSK